MLSRRGFFVRVFGAAIAARLAPLLASDGVVEYATNTTGTVGGINRSTCSFWRNQHMTYGSSSFDGFESSLRSLYDRCKSGARDES